MKTKMLVVFLLMMIVPVCACADVVSISELYQNNPDFWTTMISADGTQQEITVPVYIPEVADVPILRVKHKQFTDDDLVMLGGSIQKSNYYNFVIRNQGEYDVSSDDNGYYNEAVHMPAWACDDLNTVYAQNQSESLGAVIDKAILDEDRKINAQKFDSAFYSNPDLRQVKAPQAQGISAEQLLSQLKESPELANALAQLLASGKAG